jgi:hypothetical protein
MTVLDPNRVEELAACEKGYWAVLLMTLSSVFDADPGVAEHYWRGLKQAPPLQRALALHDHPLDVAATLTGRSLTADRVASYDGLRRELAEVESFSETFTSKSHDPGTFFPPHVATRAPPW